MSIFQLGATLFALFMIFWVRNNQQRQHLSVTEASMWYSIWLVFIVLSLFPDLLTNLVSALHFARVFDLLVVLAFMTLVVLNFYIYLKNKKLEHKIEEVVRKIALRKT